MNPKNLIAESCTVTGFADITLAGAMQGALAFATEYLDGDTNIPVKAEALSASGTITAWEYSLCTYVAATNSLVRTSVQRSSNGNLLVNFPSTGQKRAFVFLPVEAIGAGPLQAHIDSATPHPAYDDLPSFNLLFENALV